MVSDVNVFGHGMVDRVPSKEISSAVVDMQDCGSWELFLEFSEEMAEPNQLLCSFSSGDVLSMGGRGCDGGLLLRCPGHGSPRKEEGIPRY